MSDDNATALAELIQFLAPTTRLDVRRNALSLVASLGSNIDGSAGELFMQNDSALGKALLHLYTATASDRHIVLAAFTNFTARSVETSAYLLNNLSQLYPASTSKEGSSLLSNYLLSIVPAKLFCNLSRHHPRRIDEEFKKVDADYLDTVLKWLIDPNAVDPQTARFIGFVLLNVSTLPHVRHQLAERQRLSQLMSLLNQTDDGHLREIAAQIMRNLAFEDDLHPKLLDQDDAFLCTLVAPLLDESAKFDDDEMAKLPLRLQYFEGKREQNQEIRQAIIEALYQLCATKLGRETLRSKGIYPALRELDKAQQVVDKNEQEKQDDKPKMQAIGILGGEEEHTLHALIGILIRYESEMDIDPNLDTIRSLS